MIRAILRYKDVLAGTAQTIRANEVALTTRESAKRGLRRVRTAKADAPVIIVPKFKGETVRVRNKSLEFISSEGTRIQRLELPPLRHNTIDNFFTDLRKIDINKLEKDFPGYQIGARFFSGRTVLYSFSQLKRLLNNLQTYDTVVAAHGRKQTAEVIRNIELILVPRTDRAEWDVMRSKRKK